LGACPRPVFERYQAWQRELESEPVAAAQPPSLGSLTPSTVNKTSSPRPSTQ
jgi:hypothetical protein